MFIDIATSNCAIVLSLIEYYFIMWIYHVYLFIYQLFVHFLVVINNSVLNVYIQVFVQTYIFSSLGYICLGVELQGHMVTLCLTF